MLSGYLDLCIRLPNASPTDGLETVGCGGASSQLAIDQWICSATQNAQGYQPRTDCTNPVRHERDEANRPRVRFLDWLCLLSAPCLSTLVFADGYHSQHRTRTYKRRDYPR